MLPQCKISLAKRHCICFDQCHILLMLPEMRLKPILPLRKGERVAFVKDREGRTPLDCLCERGFDKMKSFGGLTV